MLSKDHLFYFFSFFQWQTMKISSILLFNDSIFREASKEWILTNLLYMHCAKTHS
jgi:hypothetical protein